jgi:hypothetical protein
MKRLLSDVVVEATSVTVVTTGYGFLSWLLARAWDAPGWWALMSAAGAAAVTVGGVSAARATGAQRALRGLPEPGSPPAEHTEPGSPPAEHTEPGSPPAEHTEPGSPPTGGEMPVESLIRIAVASTLDTGMTREQLAERMAAARAEISPDVLSAVLARMLDAGTITKHEGRYHAIPARMSNLFNWLAAPVDDERGLPTGLDVAVHIPSGLEAKVLTAEEAASWVPPEMIKVSRPVQEVLRGPDDPRWLPAVRRLASMMAEQTRPGDGTPIGAGTSEIARRLAAQVPELGMATVRDFVHDWMESRAPMPLPLTGRDWGGALENAPERRPLDAVIVDQVRRTGTDGIDLRSLRGRLRSLGYAPIAETVLADVLTELLDQRRLVRPAGPWGRYRHPDYVRG